MAAATMTWRRGQNLPHQKPAVKKLAPQWVVKRAALPPSRHQEPAIVDKTAARTTAAVAANKQQQPRRKPAAESLEEDGRGDREPFAWGSYKIRARGFQILRLIGEGAYGRVFQAVGESGCVALKVFKGVGEMGEGKEVTNSEAEIAMSMMLTREANKAREEEQGRQVPIVRALGIQVAQIAKVEDHNTPPELQDCMAMEMCEGGCLLGYMKAAHTMTEEQVAMFVEPIARALQFCHDKGVLHLDVKPENVLLRRAGVLGTACLADFGLSLILPRGHAYVRQAAGLGTPWYIAPEAQFCGIYCPASDVWSLGAIVFEAITGLVPPTFPPFSPSCSSPDNIIPLLRHHMSHFWLTLPGSFPAWSSLSVHLRFLLSRMLCPDPRSRLRLHELLAHPWLQCCRHLAYA